MTSLLQYVGEHRQAMTTSYGNVSPASIGAMQRGLLTLERAGGQVLFGEPALNLSDFIRSDRDGRGAINILTADRLMQAPVIYATFFLWLLAELFESLPEVGDRDKPKLVFFFDEAHVLLNDAPEALQDKIEQVVRLIRSKGIGIYFVSQNPIDIPDIVFGHLGNRVQHALRAFTPRDQRAVKAAAETFRRNPNLDVASAITELGVGEALVSVLDDNGTPAVVERALILPPRSLIGPIPAEQRRSIVNWSPMQGKYDQLVDRKSAYEILKAKAERAAHAEAAARDAKREAKEHARLAKKSAIPTNRAAYRTAPSPKPAQERVTSPVVATPTPVASPTPAPRANRGFVRGILGALLGRDDDR